MKLLKTFIASMFIEFNILIIASLTGCNEYGNKNDTAVVDEETEADFQAEREEWRTRFDNRVEEIDAEINELQAELDRNESISEETREEYNEAIADLREFKEETKEKMNNLETASEEEWNEFEKDTEQWWDGVEKEWNEFKVNTRDLFNKDVDVDVDVEKNS
mgnify:CR=1 FL=1